MRVVVIYRDKSDHAREVIDYLRDFNKQTGRELESLDPDSPEGISLCRAYDIVEYPTLLAIDGDGHMHSMWRGRPLPTINEVSFYV